MPIVPLNLADVRTVARGMRAADRAEIFATRWDEDPDLLATECLAHAGIGAVIKAADGVPVCVIGASEMWPKVWQVWMFATDRWPEAAREATRLVRRWIIPALYNAGCHRAECRSSAAHVTAHRWLERLGAERESLHRAYGKNKENFIGYYWRRENVRNFQKTKDAQNQADTGAAKG